MSLTQTWFTLVNSRSLTRFENRITPELSVVLRSSSEAQLCNHYPCTSLKSTPFTDHRLPITVYRSPFTDHRLPITVYRSPFTDHRLPITVYRSPFTYHRLPITVYLSPFTYHRLPITAYLSPLTDHRLPITGCVHAISMSPSWNGFALSFDDVILARTNR